MKKAITLMVLAMVLMVAGCSKKSETTTVNIENLANELMENVQFEDELSQVDSDMVEKLYNINNASSSYVYIGSGATAEEIAVFEFKDEESAKQGLDKANTRISEQKDSYATYIPEEVQRLDNAIVKQSGRYLVVCVSDDSKAEDIISKYIK